MTRQEKLQRLVLGDQQGRGWRSRLDAATRRHEAQHRKLEQYRQQHAELSQQLRQSRAHASELEAQSQSIEQKVSRAREQMNAVKSNKEYSALLVEVNTLKQEKARKEEEALEAMTRAEELQGEADRLAGQIAEQEKLVAVSEKEVADRRAEVGERLDEAETNRAQAAADLPVEALKMFERLTYAHDGEAMSHVIETDRKRHEYTCGGCYMQVPFERVNAVLSKPDQLTVCPNCDRILYMSDDAKSEMVAK